MAKFTNPLDPDQPPFQIPASVINTLNEMTGGNFLLFYIDSKGSPNQIAGFQNEISEIGLRSHVTTFINSINQAEDIKSVQGMIENSEMIDEDDGEFDEFND